MADYERFIRYQAQSQDTGQAQVFATLSDRLRDFSNQIYEQQVVPAVKAKAQVAGAAAGAAGTPQLKSNFTLYGRAYNDSAVRAYAMSQYSDIEQTMGQFEAEAGTDAAKFTAKVEGYRNGALQGVIPEARPFIQSMVQERSQEGLSRITTAARVQAKQTIQVQIAAGLDVMAGKISQYYTEATPESVAKAQVTGQVYLDMVDRSVADGTFTPQQGQAVKDNHLKQSMEWLSAGRLQAEYRRPNGNPVQVIKDVLSNPALTDDDRQTLGRNLFNRLNLLQTADREASVRSDAEFKAEAEAADRDLTSMLLRGKLTIGKIDEAVRLRGLNPSRATALMEKLSSGPGADDARERFKVETNLLTFTSDEIANNPRLSWDTKRTLIDKLNSRLGGWQDSNPSQEARRRIDNSLGIVQGIPNPLLTAEIAAKRGEALTAWYDAMELVPPAERDAKALTIADQVINTTTSKFKAKNDVARLTNRLTRLQKQLAETRGKEARAAIEAEIATVSSNLTAAQGRLQ
jgi:polyhydroxyalkanoate synthesis regulator phasin